MDQKSIKFMLPLIIFLAGWIIGGHFLIGLFLGGVATVVLPLLGIKLSVDAPRETIFNDDSAFIHIVLLLSAAVIKADGRIYKKERELVRRRLSHDFGPAQVEKYMQDLAICLEKNVNVPQVCATIKDKLNYPSKIQLLHFLAGLTVTNGTIVDAEFELLRRISSLIDLPERSFASILAMFSYQRIRSYDDQSSNSNYRSRPTSTSQLSKAFQILEIDSDASDDEVKKAYRRLAKIHHPDRVVHLGPEFQKNAKVKFQKISDAYELIKSRRNIK